LTACTNNQIAATGSAAVSTPQAPSTPTRIAVQTQRATAAPTNDPAPTASPKSSDFNGESAYIRVVDQLDFGPRWPGSPGHDQVGDYIVAALQELGWDVQEQLFDYRDIVGRNIIGKQNEGLGPVIILGAHYDTRKIADQTPGSTASVPGAVDGASGVAVLIELARTLELQHLENEIWLAFFDVEDNGSGGIPGYDWIVGSSYMANNLPGTPQAMVLVDMVGDADQQLYLEGNSDPALQQRIWDIADGLGYGNYFIKEYRHTMIDDHLPFAQMGIPAIDIIDFDYPYWHTVDDTADKVSPESLARVGRTLEMWLEK
jgi:Zn-dependent M28 family amino/carboxypeptidase